MQQFQTTGSFFFQDLRLIWFSDWHIEASVDSETQIVQFLSQIPSDGSFAASNEYTFAIWGDLQNKSKQDICVIKRKSNSKWLICCMNVVYTLK